MNLLDKLFSREIERRTGAHAISIYIEENREKRKRSRSIGTSAIEASRETKITTRKSDASFIRRIDLRFPWLKLAVVTALGIIIILDLLNLTISSTGERRALAKIAPMSKHIKIAERIVEGKKLVALTFDDGPSPLTTPKLLDVLKQKHVPATFFVLGNRALDNPDVVKRALDEGHEIASHTMRHQNLIRISAEAAKNDINEAKSAIKSIIGKTPAYTRPPYGNFDSNIIKSAGTPIILWSVDTEDWRSKNVDSIISTALDEVHDGAIILMHDIYPTSVEAVPKLIDAIREKGYEFASFSEISKIRGTKIKEGIIYYNFRL